jgi:hypothetical protein
MVTSFIFIGWHCGHHKRLYVTYFSFSYIITRTGFYYEGIFRFSAFYENPNWEMWPCFKLVT